VVLCQRRPQPIVPAGGLIPLHAQRPLPHGRQLLADREAVDRHRLQPRAPLLEQRRDPHHEELVEVGADDGEELDPFEKGVIPVESLIEDPLVERQPAELAVAMQARIVEVEASGGR
jgi:hypothetical protein